MLVAAALVAGCSGSGLGDDAAAPAASPAADRRPAPAFSLPPVEGTERVTLDGLRGKPALINFWASWCGPCRKETPDLVAFARAHPGIQVVGIASDDALADSRAFAEEFEIPYLLASDRTGAVGAKYEILGLPATFVIDAEGRIVSEIPGPVTRADLEDLAGQVGA